MKRIISLFLAVLMVSGLALTVYADMGGPMYYEFEVMVSNPEGAKDRNSYSIVPYQTKLTVKSEYSDFDTGEMYSNVEYNGDYLTLKSSDLAKSEPKVGMDKAVKLNYFYERVVMSEEGEPLREGPSKSFDVVTTIPYGTEFKSQYGSSDTSVGWLFISYKNYNGWIYIYDDNQGIKSVNNNKKTNFIEVLDGGHYIYPNSSARENGTEIPAGTKLSYKYYDRHFGNIYVEYNGVKGWVDTIDMVYGIEGDIFDLVKGADSGLYINTDSVELYKEPYYFSSTTPSEVLTTVPKGEFLYVTKSTSAYNNSGSYGWYYTEYDGQSGWIKYDNINNDSDSVIILEQESVFKPSENVSVFSEPSETADIIGEKNANTKFSAFGGYRNGYYLTECGGEYGWVKADFEVLEEVGETDFYASFALFKPNGSEIQPFDDGSYVDETTDVLDKDNEKETKSSSFTPVKMIAACVFAACILAGTAVIIIIVRNRKS